MPKISIDPNDPIYARILENKRTISKIKNPKLNSVYPISIKENKRNSKTNNVISSIPSKY